MLTLEGQPADGLDGLLLESFCSTPLPKLNAQQEGGMMHYTLADVGSGPASAVDLFIAERTPGCMRRFNTTPEHAYCGPSSMVTTPVTTLVFDILLHEDAFPGQAPSLRVHDTALGGVVDINDRARDIDRLDVSESIEELGWNAATFRASEIPHYSEIIAHVCDQMDWDSRKFRGYRCRSQYPVYGSQLSMVFEPPRKP